MKNSNKELATSKKNAPDYSRKIALTVGGAALGLGGLAEAGIVHYDTSNKFTVDFLVDGDTLWDVDFDETNPDKSEFVFRVSTSTTNGNVYGYGAVKENNLGNTGGNFLFNGGDIATLSLGATVAGTSFSNGADLFSSTAPYAPFAADQNYFIGFSFFQGGDELFGWASWSFGDTTMTVNEWAYCDTDGCSITAGQTTADVPEPALPSLLLLGLGAAGVARWKKNKREAAA